MKYAISTRAKIDIEEIWLYSLHTWSIEQADRYFNLKLNYAINN